MKRTARLVRRALEGRPAAPDPWIRGAADVAAAVARSSASSRHEGAPAAGGPGGVISTRDPSHTAGGLGGGSGRQLAHAAGGPGAVSSRDIAHAAGGPGAISSRDIAHAAGGVTSSRHAVLGAVRGSEVKKGKGGEGAVQVHGEHYSLQGGQGGRGDRVPPAECGQGERVGSKATAGPGRGLALAASLHTEGADHHPTDSSGSASSSKVCPITVHDKIFVSSQKSKDRELHAAISGDDEEWSTGVDVSDEITSYLTQSIEPIVSFRVDSSKWPNSTCLETWLDLLSVKSVQELDLLNLGHRVSTVFPIDCLQSKNLQVLRIGFFAVILDLLCFNYSSLHTLEFFSCTLEGNKLSWVVTDCPALKVLKVYYCSVDLHIKSNTLQVLDCFGNIGNRIVIASSPKLLSIACGINAKQKSAIVRQKILASIYLSDVPSLKFMSNLSLPYNKILVNTKDLTKVVVPLPVVRLCLSLEMSNSMQLQHLHKLLESFPMLQSLSIMRMDNVARDEGFYIQIDEPFKDIGMLDCVKNCLTSFSLKEFRGGESENHLIKCLLKNAPNLIHLSTTRYESTSKKAIRHAVKEIKSCDRASEDCQFSFE